MRGEALLKRGAGREGRHDPHAGRAESYRRGHQHASGARHRMRRTAGALACALLLSGCGSPGRRWTAPPEGTTATGVASWYGPGFHGKRTANGERFDQEASPRPTACGRSGPGCGSRLSTNKSVVVTINDRIPRKDRIIDLSKGAARAVGLIGPGIGKVRLEVVEEAPPKRARPANGPRHEDPLGDGGRQSGERVQVRPATAPQVPSASPRPRRTAASPRQAPRPKRSPARASWRASAPGAPSPARPSTSAARVNGPPMRGHRGPVGEEVLLLVFPERLVVDGQAGVQVQDGGPGAREARACADIRRVLGPRPLPKLVCGRIDGEPRADPVGRARAPGEADLGPQRDVAEVGDVP